ncbi:MAG: hypothetical protein KA196_03105 [Arenimonas sp.]|nr:hypothetical protein [Arenimonas sp.]
MTSHDPITPRARRLFDAAAARLDAPMAQSLQRARRQALDGTARPARSHFGAIPAGAFAAAVLALGLAWWLPTRTVMPVETPAVASAPDADAILASEDAELYAWLGDAPVATGDAELGL